MQTSWVRYFFIFLLFLPLVGPAVKADNADALFNDAYRLLHSRDYWEACKLFSVLCRAYPDHGDAPAHLFFKAKAGYYAGDYTQSVHDFNLLIDKHPDSEYIPYCYLFLGNAFYRLSQPDRAVDCYLDSYELSRDRKLDNLLLEVIEISAGDTRVPVAEKVNALSIAEGRRCALKISAARGLMRRGNYQTVSLILSSCRDAEAARLTDEANRRLEKHIEVGVVLPLSGDLQKFGEQVLDGIKLMAEKFRAETGEEITLVVYDTRGDNLEAARIVRRLFNDGTTAAIGPLTSEETAVASAALSCGDMPLVVPAASQGGLTELSQTCFQLRPNLDWQGIRMADLAVKWLRADTAAIITPTSPENLRMARAFAGRFKELGGTILGIEYFRVRETDFGPYIRDIKSLIVSELLDSIVFIDEDGDTAEAEEIPVWLDCLFIPAQAGQLRQLLPQILFYNLNTVYLGGDGWGNSAVYDLGEDITRTCYFSSGVIADDTGIIAQQFSIDFDRRYGRQPGHLEALGYDAMGLICQALMNGHYSHSEINRYLSSVKNYQGAAGAVTFGKNRENIELPIYTIEDGTLRQVTFSTAQNDRGSF